MADEMERRKKLEGIVGELAPALDLLLKERNSGKRLGFAFVIFEFGDKSQLAYVGNTDRSDLAKVLQDLAIRLEGGIITSKGDA
jgi:hypothetical protein